MTDLLLPTDGCPECVSSPNHPYRVVPDADGQGCRAWYRCRWCHNGWWTSWGLGWQDLPCPGCPECSPSVKARTA